MEFIKGFFGDMPIDMWSDGAMGKFMALIVVSYHCNHKWSNDWINLCSY